AGDGGYARALTADERQAQQDELAAHIARHDVVITTAQVPGLRPPVLVTADALKTMAAGSVVIDMGASDLGGNVEGSAPDETVTTENGVTVIGAGRLPSTMPAAASAMYARNVSSLLMYLVKDGELALDLSDDLQAGVVLTRDGSVIHPALAKPETGPAPETEPAGGAARVDGAAD
ncbi:MAG: NAD(P) transhydrogenase subunit alpha, partial [Actinomycetota bacterium]